jgi:hypothetical protein
LREPIGFNPRYALREAGLRAATIDATCRTQTSQELLKFS